METIGNLDFPHCGLMRQLFSFELQGKEKRSLKHAHSGLPEG